MYKMFLVYRGFAAGIYTTNSAEACLHCAERSRANIIVVEDAKQLEKIMQIKSKLPALKAIIQYEGTPLQKGILSVNSYFVLLIITFAKIAVHLLEEYGLFRK